MASVILVITTLIAIASGQSTVNPSTPSWIDPHTTGKHGNPGARVEVCKKSLDGIHVFASEMIARAILSMTVADSVHNVGTGVLTVKPPRVTEARYGRYEYEMIPPNRIRSRFFDGRIVANGVWQYKPNNGELMGGTYKGTFFGTELNVTDKLGRTADAKPSIEMIECKANLSSYRIEVDGSSEIPIIENCDMDVCILIRQFFEKTICKLFESFIKEVINRELQNVPTRMVINGDNFKVDYGLLNSDHLVNNKCIVAGLEGKHVWRGSNYAPFNPSALGSVDRNRMYTFQISDYTFNTLLYQAHSYGHKFSTAELVPQTSAIHQALQLYCGVNPITTTSPPTSTTPKSARKHYRKPAARAGGDQRAPIDKCLGTLFENSTNFGPYSASDFGDIVYKSQQKPAAVHVESDKRGMFDASGGQLEIYGPAGHDGISRPLLARVDIPLLRGEFTPAINKANVTGRVKIHSLQLSHAQAAFRNLNTPEWLSKMSQFATPVLTEMFNAFLSQHAQFPLPLPSKYPCLSPEFTVLPRTMQVDCDVQAANRDGQCPCFHGTCVCMHGSL